MDTCNRWTILIEELVEASGAREKLISEPHWKIRFPHTEFSIKIKSVYKMVNEKERDNGEWHCRNKETGS